MHAHVTPDAVDATTRGSPETFVGRAVTTGGARRGRNAQQAEATVPHLTAMAMHAAITSQSGAAGSAESTMSSSFSLTVHAAPVRTSARARPMRRR